MFIQIMNFITLLLICVSCFMLGNIWSLMTVGQKQSKLIDEIMKEWGKTIDLLKEAGETLQKIQSLTNNK